LQASVADVAPGTKAVILSPIAGFFLRMFYAVREWCK